MNIIEGNIVDVVQKRIFKGRIFFDKYITLVNEDDSITANNFIMPGFVDAHLHIESTMLIPSEYAKKAIEHGVIAAITDPHEIANVCGVEGIKFMINDAKRTPMKIYFGAPSCVPATIFETNGAKILSDDVDYLFKENMCFHLSEMMNFPGVINDDPEILRKIQIAKKYKKNIDGHAPLLSGIGLKKYIKSGITTDHETTKLSEAKEKIRDGMKIILRESSASRDFNELISLIETNNDKTMMCTDDCHPDDLEKGYINDLVKKAVNQGFDLFKVLNTATKNAKEHYGIDIGLLQVNETADFIVVNNLKELKINEVYIDGEEVLNQKRKSIHIEKKDKINNFVCYKISKQDIKFIKESNNINVIQLVEDSIITRRVKYSIEENIINFESSVKEDILKIVVVNRYKKAKPSVGFIKGFKLKRGALASSVAHDSHNIVVVGVNDNDILSAIEIIQQNKGGLVVVDGDERHLLELPIGGIMSDKNCSIVAEKYKELNEKVQRLGCSLHAPFMTLSFMSLLVIPEFKISDMGLFDVNTFSFMNIYAE